MSIQYQDRTFSENMLFDEALVKFQEEITRPDNPARSLHVGTTEELEEIKTEKSMESRMDYMEELVESLKPKKPSSIFEPTREQIEYVMNNQ